VSQYGRQAVSPNRRCWLAAGLARRRRAEHPVR